MRIKSFYSLAKPGMVYGNLLTAVAGYLLASGLKAHLRTFIGMLVGTALVMGAACVINNLKDRDIDQLMERTKKRPSVSGDVSFKAGVVYAAVMATVGFTLLLTLTNIECTLIGLIGFVDYAFIYTYFKRRTHHATLIGSIAGAAPIVGGYVAYGGHITSAALLVGAMMFLWQMPHFYAIALFRKADYSAAKVPVLPLAKGNNETRLAMVIYTVLFALASIALYYFSHLSFVYLAVMVLAAMFWLAINVKGLLIDKVEAWAKQSFFTSLIVMMVMSVMVALR